MDFWKNLKGAIEMIVRVVTPRKTGSSLLGRRKYFVRPLKKGALIPKSSILGLTKYNQNSGVDKYGTRNTSYHGD